MKKCFLSLLFLASFASAAALASDEAFPPDKNIDLLKLDGTSLKLTDQFKGQYIVLDFSAPWCSYCVELGHSHDSNPDIQSMFNGEKCSFATLVLKRELQEWVNIFTAGGFMAVNSFGVGATLKTIAGKFGFTLEYIPSLLVIDREGKLVASKVGEMPSEVEQLCR